jgi:hypothetical protein
MLTQQSVGADISWHFPNRMSFGISAGAVIGGRFSYADTSITLKAGPILSFKGSRILLTEYRIIPFIVGAIGCCRGILCFLSMGRRWANKRWAVAWRKYFDLK